MLKTTRPLLIALGVALLVPLVAWAGRVSLAGIDAKLDRLLEGPYVPARHVTLELVPGVPTVCGTSFAYVRSFLDGTQDSVEFAVPRNATLFITDISMRTVGSPSTFVGGRVLYTKLIAVESDGSGLREVFQSSPVVITTESSNGSLGTRDVSIAGVAISEGRRVCPQAISVGETSGGVNSVIRSVLHGVLVPD